MKVHHPDNCSCHAASGPGSPSTNYFVLGLSVVLVVAGLFQLGVLRLW